MTEGLIVLVLVGGFVGFLLVLAWLYSSKNEEVQPRSAASRNPNSSPVINLTSMRSRSEVQRVISRIDLYSVAHNMQSKLGWEASRTEMAEKEYRKFLFIAATNQGQIIVPWSDDLDQFWHQHILDTKQYKMDSQKIFGRYFEHDPNTTVTDPEKHRKNQKKTEDLYYDNFEGANSSMANSLMFGAVLGAGVMYVATPQVEPRRERRDDSSGGSSCGGDAAVMPAMIDGGDGSDGKPADGGHHGPSNDLPAEAPDGVGSVDHGGGHSDAGGHPDGGGHSDGGSSGDSGGSSCGGDGGGSSCGGGCGGGGE